MGSGPVVLLARNELTRTVYALERQHNALYVACRLGPWVDLEQLARHATALCHDRIRPATKRESIEQNKSVSLTTPQLHKEQKQKRVAIEAIQSLVRKRARSQSVSTFDGESKHEEVTESATLAQRQLPSPVLKHEEPQDTSNLPTLSNQEVVASGEAPPRQTADDIFETIRTQYSEALYKSMVCLNKILFEA